jgi:hypothetical protein
VKADVGSRCAGGNAHGGGCGAILVGIRASATTAPRLIASTIGTTIEWYDFLIYGTVTRLVFTKLYFPQSAPLTGTLQAFAIYAVGFVARPVGAAVFGHYGDRLGRKAALIATLLLMGIATFFVAFVPGYARIGIWGAVILTVLRTVQGIGVGGEWGGSVLMSMEWARTSAHRGFIAAWPQFGVPASGPQFITWGWRIPFVLSMLLVGVGLYIRLGILETPAFARLVAENKVEPTPIIEVIKRQPREIVLTALVRLGELYLHRVCLHLLDDDPAQFTRLAADRGSRRLRPLVLYDPVCRASIGPDRPQAHVYDRRSRHGGFRLSLFCPAQHPAAGLDLFRHLPVADPARSDVRPAGGADCRMLHRPAALQRRVARLSARVRHRPRPGAADRDGAGRRLSIGLRHRRLYPVLRGRQSDLRRPCCRTTPIATSARNTTRRCAPELPRGFPRCRNADNVVFSNEVAETRIPGGNP